MTDLPFSPVVRAGEWLVVSGQTGVSDGHLVEGMGAQVRQCLDNLGALLASEGAGLTDVVRCGVYLTHMSDFATMNEVYAEVFGTHRPARTTIEVDGLPGGAIVEIDAWAYVGSRPRPAAAGP